MSGVAHVEFVVAVLRNRASGADVRSRHGLERVVREVPRVVDGVARLVLGPGHLAVCRVSGERVRAERKALPLQRAREVVDVHFEARADPLPAWRSQGRVAVSVTGRSVASRCRSQGAPGVISERPTGRDEGAAGCCRAGDPRDRPVTDARDTCRRRAVVADEHRVLAAVGNVVGALILDDAIPGVRQLRDDGRAASHHGDVSGAVRLVSPRRVGDVSSGARRPERRADDCARAAPVELEPTAGTPLLLADAGQAPVRVCVAKRCVTRAGTDEANFEKLGDSRSGRCDAEETRRAVARGERVGAVGVAGQVRRLAARGDVFEWAGAAGAREEARSAVRGDDLGALAPCRIIRSEHRVIDQPDRVGRRCSDVCPSAAEAEACVGRRLAVVRR